MPMSENQSLIRAVEILDCFQPGQPELGVRAIARRINLPASTVGRLLATLCTTGILRQNPETHRYRMGSHVSMWSSVFFSQLDLRTEARSHLARVIRAQRTARGLGLHDVHRARFVRLLLFLAATGQREQRREHEDGREAAG